MLFHLLPRVHPLFRQLVVLEENLLQNIGYLVSFHRQVPEVVLISTFGNQDKEKLTHLTQDLRSAKMSPLLL